MDAAMAIRPLCDCRQREKKTGKSRVVARNGHQGYRARTLRDPPATRAPHAPRRRACDNVDKRELPRIDQMKSLPRRPQSHATTFYRF